MSRTESENRQPMLVSPHPNEASLTHFQAMLVKAGEQAADTELRRIEGKIGKLIARFEWMGIELGGELANYKDMLGVVRGCRGRWSAFLRSVGLAESTARMLMHCHRQFGTEAVKELLRQSGTLPTTILKLAPPSVPQAAHDEFLAVAETKAVSPKEADEMIARHKAKTIDVRPQSESFSIDGIGRVVLHPSKDADERWVKALKQAITRWADQRVSSSDAETIPKSHAQ